MRSYSTPWLIPTARTGGALASPLTAVSISSQVEGATYDERWLQSLIDERPSLLPTGDIEPGLADAVSVCTELNLPAGYVDNLLLTPGGGLVLVEVKLWRNPEARRAVVAQIIDYAKDMAQLSYEQLQQGVSRARKDPSFDLYRHVCGVGAPPEGEARFVDAVARNLRLGRFLLLIVGDGIREHTEQITEYLQRHIGLHFSLALIELALWEVPGGEQVLVQPRVLARTVEIERAVIRIEGDQGAYRLAIEPASPAASQPVTLTAESFYERLGAIDHNLPDKLKAFLTGVEPLGVWPEYRVMLTLKWRDPLSGRAFNLGVIDNQGRLFTDQTHSAAAAIDKLTTIHAYKAALAKLVPGSQIERTDLAMGVRLQLPPGSAPLSRLLDSANDWIAAIDTCIRSLADLPNSHPPDQS